MPEIGAQFSSAVLVLVSHKGSLPGRDQVPVLSYYTVSSRHRSQERKIKVPGLKTSNDLGSQDT